MKSALRFTLLSGLLMSAAVMTACEEDDGGATDIRVDTVRVTVRDTVRIGNTAILFDQIEHLANPLVSEALVEKREHDHYNNTIPSETRTFFRDDLVSFITGVAGRDAAYAGAVADALLPDVLFARLDRARGTNDANVGWLTHVLDPANGYGGRKLTGDDVVDKALSVVFGNALGNNNNVSPGLVTDNVSANDRQHSTTFPYIAAPN